MLASQGHDPFIRVMLRTSCVQLQTREWPSQRRKSLPKLYVYLHGEGESIQGRLGTVDGSCRTSQAVFQGRPNRFLLANLSIVVWTCTSNGVTLLPAHLEARLETLVV
jgi:hypothetical protein